MDLNSYFKTIAEEHVDILHNEDDTVKAYFRSYSSATILLDNEFHKNLRYSKDNILISQFNNDGGLPLPSNDFPWSEPNGTLFILSRIIDTNIEAAISKAIEIRNDILARYKQDLKDGQIDLNFMISSVQSQSIGRIADNYYGIALFISYSETYKNTYDITKWQSLIS